MRGERQRGLSGVEFAVVAALVQEAALQALQVYTLRQSSSLTLLQALALR